MMESQRFAENRFAERHPVIFSFLILLLFFFVNAIGAVAARLLGLPATTFAAYTEILLVIVLVVLISAMSWWKKIGFRAAQNWGQLALYAPALVLIIGNLSFGLRTTPLPLLLSFLILAAASGFAEEVTFRGLILRAFLPRGAWAAVLASTAFFGFAHIFNVLGASSPAYVAVQIAYALAIGFCFGAMVVRGHIIWPLIVVHGFGNLISFLNSGQVGGDVVTPQLIIVAVIYIVVFTAYGWYLMRSQPDSTLLQSLS